MLTVINNAMVCVVLLRRTMRNVFWKKSILKIFFLNNTLFYISKIIISKIIPFRSIRFCYFERTVFYFVLSKYVLIIFAHYRRRMQAELIG